MSRLLHSISLWFKTSGRNRDALTLPVLIHSLQSVYHRSLETDRCFVAAHKLLLHPSDHHSPVVSVEGLSGRLQAIGLIGQPVDPGGSRFYPTGENFLQLITFLGCSPAIELEPPSDPALVGAASAAGRFCHVFLSCTDELQFRMDAQTQPPRCPQCRNPERAWQEKISRWQKHSINISWQCPDCGFTGQLTDLAFRKTAGFGRTFVEIRGIYPSEAVPGETLMATLRSLTGGDWKYIFIRE